jgi:hypothetical protein
VQRLRGAFSVTRNPQPAGAAFEAGYLVAELSFTIGDRKPRPRKKTGGILLEHHDPHLSMCPPMLAKLKRQKP